MVTYDPNVSPALVLDLDALQANIATMSDHARKAGVSLRCHAKCHKSPEIARLLAAAGAIGPACATIAEASAMARNGLRGILVTSPITALSARLRLQSLLARDADLCVVVDSPAAVQFAADAAANASRRLGTLVELDVGVGRTGCVEVSDALALARTIAANENLRFAGVQAYWGNLQHVADFGERAERVSLQARRLSALIDALRGEDFAPEIVTGGGTGTSWIDPDLGLFTEIQPGSFLFLDSCYATVHLRPGQPPFTPSLFVAATVVTANRPGRIIVDAGLKAFATDSGKPLPVRGAPKGATYTFMGDEHGAIDFSPDQPSPHPGDLIELLTSHVDPTVNLHGEYHVRQGGTFIGRWPIVARGFDDVA